MHKRASTERVPDNIGAWRHRCTQRPEHRDSALPGTEDCQETDTTKTAKTANKDTHTQPHTKYTTITTIANNGNRTEDSTREEDNHIINDKNETAQIP